jgi:hypothetical protein
MLSDMRLRAVMLSGIMLRVIIVTVVVMDVTSPFSSVRFFH